MSIENRPTFGDANALEKTQRAKLQQKLEKALKAAEKAGDQDDVKELKAQLADLDKDEVVTSAAIKQLAKEGKLDESKVKGLLEKYNQDGDGLYNASEFDQLMAEAAPAKAAGAAASTQPSQPAAPPEVPPEKVGVVLNDHPNDLPSAAELKEFGATGVRLTLSADNYNDQTKAAMKAKLAEYKAAGIEVTLQLGKEFAKDCPVPENCENKPVDKQSDAWNQKFDDWMDKKYLPRVNEAMSELGPYVDGVEAFNEPDEPNNRSAKGNEQEYKPGLPAEKFGEALKKTYEAVHNHPNAQKDVKVISGGLDSGHPEYLEKAAAATGGTLYADEIGLHPYAKDPKLPDSDPNSLGYIVNDYAKRDWKTPTGEKPKIAITEASQPRVDDAKNFNSDFAKATVDQDAVSRSYFFWTKTHDDHPGLVNKSDKQKSDSYKDLQRLMGKGKK